jgi:hypothetical protein
MMVCSIERSPSVSHGWLARAASTVEDLELEQTRRARLDRRERWKRRAVLRGHRVKRERFEAQLGGQDTAEHRVAQSWFAMNRALSPLSYATSSAVISVNDVVQTVMTSASGITVFIATF